MSDEVEVSNRIRRRARRYTLIAAGLTAALIGAGVARVVEPDSCYALALIGGMAVLSFGSLWIEAAAVCGHPIARRLDLVRRSMAHDD